MELGRVEELWVGGEESIVLLERWVGERMNGWLREVLGL
jgi:hypothetical protein